MFLARVFATYVARLTEAKDSRNCACNRACFRAAIGVKCMLTTQIYLRTYFERKKIRKHNSFHFITVIYL